MPDKYINKEGVTKIRKLTNALLLENVNSLRKQIQTALNTKQDTLVNGTNIKTVDGVSILGSGNIQTVNPITDAEIELLFNDPDPILSNNSWGIIKAICEAGNAANYWALGDTKTDIGTDGVTRTFRIADMQGLYGKHVVFEQVELESTGYSWNQTSNVDMYNCINNYSISQMRTTHLPAILAKYSDELQSAITNTKYKVATNGRYGTILELEDKLFLAAEREILGSRVNSRTDEWNALKRFQIYAANDTNEFRKKYKLGTSSVDDWWLRSPMANASIYYREYACLINENGGTGVNYNLYSSLGVAPFFSF